MAETETAEQTQSEETGGNGATIEHDTRKTAVRAAAIAAASGATALAAKKAFSGRGQKADDEGEGGDRRPARKKGDGDESVFSSMLTSSWESARGSLVPMLEDAATSAGEYVARNAPDVVSEKLVPQFIRGFERGRQQDKSRSSGDSDEE
jgi:hypothetical protein